MTESDRPFDEGHSHFDDFLRRLGEHSSRASRYTLKGEVARGGMGVILRVRDEDLRRDLAMKVVLGKTQVESDDGTSAIDPVTLGRFLDEAQVTGMLDHPGIVPVHELGVDDEGRVYFTMRLVRGRDLKSVFLSARQGNDDWNRTRVLGVLLKACEAIAYAHDHGVVHRDLKPSNIMVGRYGEVYVMDWGLAQVKGRKDTHDLRLQPDTSTSLKSLRTVRRDEAEDTPDSPLLTMDGAIMGTPDHMSPEQARGDVERIGPRTDVYAMGVMLYELLTGRTPFNPPDARRSPRMIVLAVQEETPKPVHGLAPDAPAELAAICERAMARELADRYADVTELASDLRAYLEGHVVRAYETGAVAELRKWVVRNKALAAALVAGVLLLAGGLTSSLILKAQSDDNAAEARRERASVLRLSAAQILEGLQEEADVLWPATPAMVERYDRWLEKAYVLVAGLDPSLDGKDIGHREELEQLLKRSSVTGEDGKSDSWKFGDVEMWWHDQLVKLIDEIEAFADPETGLIDGLSEEHGWGMRRRREFAATVEARTVTGEVAQRRWTEAIASIADREQCPSYDGLALTPQLGLLPISRDPASGLWEFWHVQSGDEPERVEDGKLTITEETGIVLVLIPGGTFWMGAQSTNPAGRNYDRDAKADESPVHEVALSPYLLSKYEMTQGQWERFTGSNPSNYQPGDTIGEHRTTLLHPVEHVSWEDAMDVLPRLELELPTEAQWERGTRAGSDTPWSTGRERDTLIGAINLADKAAAIGGATWMDIEDWPELDDGWVVHAEVGSFRPNAYGLHDVHGKIYEWCRDGYDDAFYGQSPEKDPLREPSGVASRVYRGGAFLTTAAFTRSAARDSPSPVLRMNFIGLRPARAITP